MALFTQDSMSDPAGGVQVDFLLPTGILVPIDCKGTQTMEEIKEALWTQGKQLPLFDRVKRPEWYTLVFVNRQAEQEECLDESQRLCDIRWYKPLFKVVEKKGDSDEKLFASKIGWLTGKCLRDFEAIDDPAVDDFRMSMLEKCKLAIEARNAGSFEEKVLYCYPPDIENTEEVTPLVQERLNPKGGFYVTVCAPANEQRYKLSATPYENVSSLLEKALRSFNRTLGMNEQGEAASFLLKVCGRDEYLLGDHCLIRYKCIKRMLSKGNTPMLALVLKSSVKLNCPREQFYQPSIPKKEKQSKELTQLLDVEDKFQLKIISACNLNVGKDALMATSLGRAGCRVVAGPFSSPGGWDLDTRLAKVQNDNAPLHY